MLVPFSHGQCVQRFQLDHALGGVVHRAHTHGRFSQQLSPADTWLCCVSSRYVIVDVGGCVNANSTASCFRSRGSSHVCLIVQRQYQLFTDL